MTSLILAVLLAASGPAGSQALAQSAQAAAAPIAEPSAKASKGHDRLVCRNEDRVGSNIQVRTCKTQLEWDAQERGVERFFHDARDYGAQQTGVSRSGGPM